MKLRRTDAPPISALVPWLVGIFACTTIVLSAVAADRVTVRAGVHQDFGRLVFDWTQKVNYSTTVADRVLSVRFDRPIDPIFGNILQDLDTHILSVRLAPDKQTVVVGLKSNYDLRTSNVGYRVVVDLLNGKTGPEAKTTENQPRKSGGAKEVDVSVSFGELGVKATKAASATISGAAAAQTLPVRTGDHPNYGRLVFAWPRKVGFTVVRNGRSVTIKFDSGAKLDMARLRRELPRQISSAVQHASTEGLEVSLVVPDDAQLRYFHNDSDVVIDVVTERGKATVKKVERKATRPRGSIPVRDKMGKKRRERANYPFVSVEATQIGTESILKFNWRQPVSAAVFRRGSSLLIHFDHPARLEMGSIHTVGNSRFGKAEQNNSKNSVHVRLPVSRDTRTRVRREGTVWVVELGPGRKRAVRSVPVTVRKEAGKGIELLIKAERPGAISVIRDDIVGDDIYAVPLRRDGLGMRRTRRFPDFELFRSSQGVAIRPMIDSLHIRSTPAGLVVSKPGGLNISPEAVAMVQDGPHGGEDRLLRFKDWRHGPVSDYQKVERELFHFTLRPKGIGRDAARLGLAKFYVSHGMGAEALGVINTMLADNPRLLADRTLRTLRGIANYQIGHYAKADADLSHPSLAGIRELYPWRAGIAAARGDWEGAHRLFVDTDVIMATLPSEFGVNLGLLAAEAALSVKEKEIAEARLGAVESLPAVGGQLDQLAYLKGHLQKLKGDTAKALALWETLEANGARPTRAKASFAKINTLIETGAIETPDAIDKLRKLQFAWRNSVFEFDLLNKLGDLYAQQRNLRSALVTLRRAVTLFKDIKGSQGLTKRMRAMFRKFYLDGEADFLQPVVALGLYNEFRELTPTGEDGDRMIHRLSERLIKVDLLEDAAKLLDHQIRFRLKGEERAQTGARLAEILLLDARPQDALTALAASGGKNISAPLSKRRRLLEAAALMDSRRYDEALGNISEDFTEEFDRLRAQIYWRAGEWQKASKVLARLTGGLDAGNLNDQDAELLLRRAVALGLASDFGGMKFLRDRFGGAMEKSKQAASFKAVAGGKLLKAEDFAALAQRAAELDTFREFMKTLNGKQPSPRPDQTATLN